VLDDFVTFRSKYESLEIDAFGLSFCRRFGILAGLHCIEVRPNDDIGDDGRGGVHERVGSRG
jgi:hypothetical protein